MLGPPHHSKSATLHYYRVGKAKAVKVGCTALWHIADKCMYGAQVRVVLH